MTESRKPEAGKAGPNEGEGNRTAARQYNKETAAHARDHDKVKAAAEKAKQAINSGDRESLSDAERKGLEKARH